MALNHLRNSNLQSVSEYFVAVNLPQIDVHKPRNSFPAKILLQL